MSTRLSSGTARPSRLVRLALLGCFAGTLTTLAGCHWSWWLHDDELAFCDDAYDDCMANARTAEDEEWCEIDVEACYEACEGEWEDEAEDDDDDGATSDEGWSGEGDGDGEATTGEDDGDSYTTGSETGDEIPPACFELHANCIGEAETLADVEACEALFEQCANPGECPSCGCPEDALDACLDGYADCSAAATSEAELDACAAEFDGCTAVFADECEVEGNPNLDACLAQHELCVACAEDDEHLAACKTVFDSCMTGVQ